MGICDDQDGPKRRPCLAAVLDAAAILTLGTGLTSLAIFAFAQVDRQVAGAAAITAFHQAREEALSSSPDQTLWSPGRRVGYEASRSADLPEPEALLRIPDIDLLVPVFSGTSDLVLNRGIGWIETTAKPGGEGNVGLAGHRDGFFRGLKELQPGAAVEIQTIEESLRYRVTDTSIVEPSDVHVLDPTGQPSITLVTCYPFYFVGHAPQRYIVRGVLEDSSIPADGRRLATADSIQQ